MLEAPATEFTKPFARYREAAHRAPVALTHHGRVTEVLISKTDFDEYMRLKSLATRALWAHELSAETLQALAEARVDHRHDHLDGLLDEQRAVALPVPEVGLSCTSTIFGDGSVIVDELHEFVWPGHDLQPNAKGEIAYRVLPNRFYQRIHQAVLEVARTGELGRVPR